MVKDPDGSFVKFPKRLFDALLRAPMPGVHTDVAFAVVRRTIGHFSQEDAEIGLQLLVDMTGHHKTRVATARQDLIREGVLVQTRPPTCTRAAMIRINRDPSTWGAYAVNNPLRDCGLSADCGQQRADLESADCGEGVSKTGTDPSANCRPMKTVEEISEEHPEDNAPALGSLLALALKELPSSESTSDDYQRTLLRHQARLPRGQIERTIYELAEFNPKKPRAKLHLTLNQWLAKEQPAKGGERDRVGTHGGRSENGEWR